jgi:hypothetical protein
VLIWWRGPSGRDGRTVRHLLRRFWTKTWSFWWARKVEWRRVCPGIADGSAPNISCSRPTDWFGGDLRGRTELISQSLVSELVKGQTFRPRWEDGPPTIQRHSSVLVGFLTWTAYGQSVGADGPPGLYGRLWHAFIPSLAVVFEQRTVRFLWGGRSAKTLFPWVLSVMARFRGVAIYILCPVMGEVS